MRKFVLALALSAAIATPAMAEPFSGPYVGAEVGLDNYEGKGEDLFAAGDSFDGISGNGVVGGVFAGYDIAVGNAFFGIEGKVSLSSAEASFDDGADTYTIGAEESFGASVRGGVMVNGSTGLFARAGWVNTSFKIDADGIDASGNDDALVLGAGLQTRLGSNASLRVEYVRTDYDDFIKNNAVLAGVAYQF
ncbi:MAG TPA: porin family protein [Croceibacterium sp.]